MKLRIWFSHPKGNYYIIEEWASIAEAEQVWCEDCPFFLYAEWDDNGQEEQPQ
jgi:hypothetical protein